MAKQTEQKTSLEKAAQRMGEETSPQKQKSSRINGKKGGRPKSHR